MAAIFISYTGRDADGEAWADRLQDWCEEWGYGFFRDKHHSAGVKAGADWRAQLFRELALATVMVCLCTRSYDRSPWCVGEVAIAVARGTTVIPIQLVNTARQLVTTPLPLLLQTDQAIQVTGASAPAAATLADVKRRLQRSLTQALNWRALLSWQEHWKPYPGLPAFEEHQAPVFFGRDDAITAISRRLSGLQQQAPALLLLLGASGYGKSSLVKAGVVPKLRAERQPAAGGGEQPSWLVLEPFKPEAAPFAALQAVLAAAGCPGDGSDPLRQLQWLSSAHQRPVLLVIDQFEELLTTAAGADGAPGEGGRFLAFLQALLEGPPARVLVLATMRTDTLAPLQSAWPRLAGLAITETLEPIAPADFGQLITGPAHRAGLSLQPGLEERLVKDSGGGDALPLLAFTLEQLWVKRQERGGPVPGERGERWDLTVADYIALGGVDGSVRTQAEACWNQKNSKPAETEALREAFLDHLVSVADDGRAAKRPALLEDLPPASRPILELMVKKRLLVSSAVNDPATDTKKTILEIAHEALLRTWEPLVQWLEENQEERLQCLRVKRFTQDLKVEAPARQRRQALEQLAALAAAGGLEQTAVAKEGRDPLAVLLLPPQVDGKIPPTAPEDDRADAALILALIGAEQPLSACLADAKAPVELRRRAAESLGLLARRSTDLAQRKRIEGQLEVVLRGEPLDVRIEPVDDPASLAMARQVAQQEVAAQVAAARASGRLAGVPEAHLLQMIQQAEEEAAIRELWASGKAPGWKEHDERLPLLQGAARGLQLAASADLPFLGSGAGRIVPMLTLTALEEGGGLHITTEVVEREVWQLPLPGGEQLELVMVPSDAYMIGSPREEVGRDFYIQVFRKCEGVDVEARRQVELQGFALVRQPISQAQWRAVAEAMEAPGQEPLNVAPGTFRPEGLWERHGQPGALPLDSVSWNVCCRWLDRLNDWLQREWIGLGGQGEAPRLALPSESQWEAACRAGARTPTPFHFGATLDERWARYDATYTYGFGRRGEYEQRLAPIGFSGLVNHWGLADLHGQVAEWCADQWQRDPMAWLQRDGASVEAPDPELADVPLERDSRLLRGGSWGFIPGDCRSACRDHALPGLAVGNVGFRVVCLPQGPSLNP
jgi:formylglycine-generating enzyme required for sulfatase activity